MDTFTSLIVFCLVCYGTTNILAYGKIFNAIRPKGVFWTCSMCLGFWVGVALSLMPNGLFSFQIDGVTQTLCGFLSSGVSYLLCSLIDDNGLRFSRRIVVDKGVK